MYVYYIYIQDVTDKPEKQKLKININKTHKKKYEHFMVNK